MTGIVTLDSELDVMRAEAGFIRSTGCGTMLDRYAGRIESIVAEQSAIWSAEKERLQASLKLLLAVAKNRMPAAPTIDEIEAINVAEDLLSRSQVK